MSDPLPPPPTKRLHDNHLLSSLTPPKKPKPAQPTTLSTSDDDEAEADAEAEAHQQLISALLASSSPYSPTSETTPFSFKVRFVPYPYHPLSPFECSSSYVTINGNEETCGSSFSDGDSSVMASVDTCGVHISDAFGFLGVGNGDVYGAREREVVEEEEGEQEEGWDWSQFLGEDEEGN